jgi:gp16 family phage-associated protein
MSTERHVKTAAEVRADLNRRGMAVTQWARERGYHPKLVFEVLRDPRRGRRGQSHEIAVLLGLKDGIIERRHHHKDEA